MTGKIILSADSTCDLGDQLKSRYGVRYFPLHITLDGKLYTDNVDITPAQTFEVYRKTGELPKTSAVNVGEYLQRFTKWTKMGYQVIHINLGSAISSSYDNALAASADLEGVHVIDSGNLSAGSGLLVLAAAERIARCMPAEQIAAEVSALRAKTHASFIIDTLEFLRAGGRCSALMEVAASLLRIKPCIEVNNRDGSMNIGRKYRGRLSNVLIQYTKDKLREYDGRIDYSRVFITHTPIDEKCIIDVRNYLEKNSCFKEIHITDACTTIGSHCGPGTLGVLFMTR